MLFRQWTKHFSSLQRKRTTAAAAVTGTSIIVGVVVCWETRLYRQCWIQDLPLAKDELFGNPKRDRTVEEVVSTVTRAGLMGHSIPGAKSVLQELDVIRRWHQERGYKGGLVLRELDKPLFRPLDKNYNQLDEDYESSTNEPQLLDLIMDPMGLAHRECYYLYYEIMGDGEIRQQIFCRGTTLRVDIYTCLQSWWVHDKDLQCRLHRGFRDHADRLLQDILPLLSPPSDQRATIEVSGHSLGGAVAFLLAAKLRQKGYNVVRVTSVAAPRFCDKEATSVIQALLPSDTLRIEDDCDLVPFLPPFGCHVGDKLWLVSDGPARFVASTLPRLSWTDSVFVNFRMWEVLSSFSKVHRIANHTRRIEEIMSDDQVA